MNKERFDNQRTMDKEQYIPYEKIASKLMIQKGDIIYLTSEVLGLARICKKNGEYFDPNRFIDSFLEIIGSEGTLLIPTFNWEFSNNGYYDYLKSPCTTGSLGKAALKRTDFKRTLHPMHSFAVWGKAKKELSERKQVDSYDNDSPFQYMLENNAKCVIVGTDYRHAYTFVHFVEKKETVPYRFTKFFYGNYIDENRIVSEREYSSYVRDLKIIINEKFNRIGTIMEKRGVSKKQVINEQSFITIDVAASYSIIAEDICYNKCGNLYDFC